MLILNVESLVDNKHIPLLHGRNYVFSDNRKYAFNVDARTKKIIFKTFNCDFYEVKKEFPMNKETLSNYVDEDINDLSEKEVEELFLTRPLVIYNLFKDKVENM